MRLAVVGCSGTGSPVVEQLARLGVRRLVLVDPDEILLSALYRQHVANHLPGMGQSL